MTEVRRRSCEKDRGDETVRNKLNQKDQEFERKFSNENTKICFITSRGVDVKIKEEDPIDDELFTGTGREERVCTSFGSYDDCSSFLFRGSLSPLHVVLLCQRLLWCFIVSHTYSECC